MATITLKYLEESAGLAGRIHDDLQSAGHTIKNAISATDDLVIILLSPVSTRDAGMKSAINQALENYQHILPIIALPVDLPAIIGNLQPLDFSAGYDQPLLLRRVDALTATDAPRPLTTLTDLKRHANARSGLMLVGVALFIFIGGIILLATRVVGVPEDEFAGVETQIFLTRNYFIDRALPRTSEEAANFEATAQKALPTIQPYLIRTATGIAAYSESTFYPRSTEEATGFPATLVRGISTVVQERMEATVTQLAVTSAAITPTPSPGS
jgi:hypothetical protein